MPSAADLLAALTPLGAVHLAGPADQAVARVAVAEDGPALGRLPPATAVLLTRAAAVELDGYRLDVLLRQAADARLALVAAYGLVDLPSTAARLAGRGGLAVVSLPDALELGQALLVADRALRPDAGSALARVLAAHAAIELAERDDVEAVLAAAARAGGVELAVAAAGPAGEPELVLPGGGGDDPAAPLVRQLAADAVGRLERRRQRRAELERRSRAQLLAELLAASGERVPLVAERARALRLDVDGWHRVARLEADAAADDPLAAQAVMDDLARLAVRVLGRPWLVAVIDLQLVVAYGDRHEGAPPPTIGQPSVERLLAAVRSALPGVDVHAGLGGVHVGVDGLRASAAEARSALEAARAAGRANAVVAYDATGLRRMLLEWLASDAARRSVHELLAPLDALGPQRGPEMVRTLAAYLDQRGSLVRAAALLHLHPNAVAYRVRRIAERLECDLADPDQRLALQIACRARLLVAG